MTARRPIAAAALLRRQRRGARGRAREHDDPLPVAGATNESDKYPNGHVEWGPLSIWTCSFYFNWPFDPNDENPNNEVVVFQATGGDFQGWLSCPPGHDTGNQCRLDAREPLGTGLVDCVVAQFAVNPDVVVGDCNATAPPAPQPLTSTS